MRFEEYLKQQKDFLNFINKDDEINSYFLGAIDALSIASHNLLPKSYKLYNTNLTDFDKYDKLVDAFKYFLCICNYYNIDKDKFDEFFKLKSIYVKNRFILKEIIDNTNKYRNIVLIDIDGILANYPDYFINKFNEVNHTNYKNYNDIPVKDRDFYKDIYRKSGEKANIPLCKNAKQFLHNLRNNGYTIILFTNRPVYLYKNITIDTIKWALKNELEFDTILYSENKMLDVIKKFDKNSIKFYIEDNYNNALNINNLGIKTYLLKTKLNKDKIKNDNNIIVINDLTQVKEAFND